MGKERLPEDVKRTIERLEREEGENVEVMNPRKGIYYAYAMTSARGDDGRPKTISRYLGRILEDGTLIVSKRSTFAVSHDDKKLPEEVRRCLNAVRKRHRRIAVIQTRAAFYIYDTCGAAPVYIGLSKPDGRFISGEAAAKGKEIGQEHEKIFGMDKTDRIILSAKSMNSRIPIKALCALSGLREGAVINKIGKLERTYGIRYMAEIDLEKLGYREVIIFIKFLEGMPGIEELSRALSEEPRIQFAAAMKGAYDMVVYAIATSEGGTPELVREIGENSLLRKHAAEWYATRFGREHGYIPPRDQFFDIVEGEKIWKKGNDTPKKGKNEITANEAITLRELNTNGLSRFTEIDKRYGLGKTASKYAYKSLRQRSGIIERTTLTMQKTPVRFIAAMIIKIVNRQEFDNGMEELLWKILKGGGEAMDRYLLAGRIETPNGIFCLAPVFRDSGLLELQEELKGRIRGVEIETMVATDILAGRLCYRLMEAEDDTQMPRRRE